MLITKEQQEALVSQYVKAGHTQDECIGFIDGIEKTIELIVSIDKRQRQEDSDFQDKIADSNL